MNNVDMCLLLINRIESSSNPHSSTSSSFKYVTFTAMWQKVLKQGKFSVSEAHFIHKSERKKNMLCMRIYLEYCYSLL